MSQAAIILFVSLVVFLILNVPVGIAIGLASLCVVFNSSRLSDSFMVQQLITGTDSFPIMAIPLFILAGELMAAGGVSKRILNEYCGNSFRIFVTRDVQDFSKVINSS